LRRASLFLDFIHDPRPLHSFPTRRSSDLDHFELLERAVEEADVAVSGRKHVSSLCVRTLPLSRGSSQALLDTPGCPPMLVEPLLDRKSTRLNSSHLGISYAVFCLKKKKKK